MIVFMLLFIAVFSLLCDLYFGFRYVRRWRGRGLRWVFAAQAVLLDVAVPVALYFIGGAYGRGEGAEQWMLWMMWMLLLSFVPKMVFAVFLLLNDGLNRLFRRRWHLFEVAGGAMASLVVGLMVYGVVHGVSVIRVSRVLVESPLVPEAFDGYRIAQFSDLHIGNLAPSGSLMRDMVDTINSLRPDLIVNSGDLVNIRSSEITPPVYRVLQGLQAPNGVVSVLGNHDLGIYIPEGEGAAVHSLARLKAIQAGLGWRLLENDRMWLTRGNDSILVSGVGFPDNGRHRGMQDVAGGSDLARAIAGYDSSHFTVLVAHTPSIWDSVPAVAAPHLTMSGHVHAMQLKLPWGRRHFSPAEWMYPEWSGLYVRNGLRLYVNDGVGYVLFPMRIGAPAEVTLYELKRSER